MLLTGRKVPFQKIVWRIGNSVESRLERFGDGNETRKREWGVGVTLRLKHPDHQRALGSC